MRRLMKKRSYADILLLFWEWIFLDKFKIYVDKKKVELTL